LSRLRWLLAHGEEAAAGAIVLALAALAFANIVARYVASYSLAFTEELEVVGLVWLTMLGAAIGFRRGAHIGFTFVRDRLPRPARRAAAVANTLLSVASMLVLVGYGWLQIRAERSLDAVSEALGVPAWLYTAAIPVGAMIVIVRVLQVARGDADAA
jgi:C4-dicarboxylate transporter, DctQ subunit